MQGTWKTTSGGGGDGIGTIGLVVLGAVVVAAIAGPVVHAITGLIHLLAIVLAIVIPLAVAALVAVLVWRPGRRQAAAPSPVLTASQVTPLSHRAAGPLPVPQWAMAALPAPERPELHFHFHGADPDEVAAIIAQHSAQEQP